MVAIGCASPAFEMSRGHCALDPGGCGDVPAFVRMNDYPRFAASRWASDGVQGLAHDETSWYIMSTRKIWKVPLSEDLARAKVPGVVPFGGRYGHLGDADFHDGLLFVPVERDRTGGPPAIGALRPDLTTLGLSPLPELDGAPWCAIHPSTGRLYISNFDTDRVEIYEVRTTADSLTLTHERSLRLKYSEAKDDDIRGQVRRVQGGVISPSGKLYLATDDGRTGIVIFDAASGAWLGRIPIEYKRRFGPMMRQEVEGIDLFDADARNVPFISGQLHILLQAGAGRGRYWFKHWAVADERDIGRL
jgi:hypothetical protein